jgi:hypothetical protein
MELDNRDTDTDVDSTIQSKKEGLFERILSTIKKFSSRGKAACVPGGSSVTSSQGPAGTMGGVVIPPNGSRYDGYALTCAHVVIGCSPNTNPNSSPNKPEKHSEYLKHGNDMIAEDGLTTTFKSPPFVLSADATIVKLKNKYPPCGTIGPYTPKPPIHPPAVNQRIKTHFPTSPNRRVKAIMGSAMLEYKKNVKYRFRNLCVTNVPLPDGLSGTIAMESSSNRILGMLFFSDRSGSYMSPAFEVSRALGIQNWHWT